MLMFYYNAEQHGTIYIERERVPCCQIRNQISISYSHIYLFIYLVSIHLLSSIMYSQPVIIIKNWGLFCENEWRAVDFFFIYLFFIFLLDFHAWVHDVIL